MTREASPSDTSTPSAVDAAAEAAHAVADHPWLERAARLGFVANGVLHLLRGILALRVVAGDEQEQTDFTGALQTLASLPWGMALIWACALGCLALALWNLGQTVFPPERGGRSGRWKARAKARAKAAGQALVFGALTVLFGSYGVGFRGDSAESSRTLTAWLLQRPGGVVLLYAVGAVLVVMAGYYVVKGVTKRFRKDLRRSSEEHLNRAVRWAGMIGYPAKGVALLALGVLVVVSTANTDPQDNTGLDGALKGIAAQPCGEIALGAVGVGLLVYAVYLAARSRYDVM
ncbi:MAG: DUF1206 domain-containing protein [Micrococcus sp.]|nr:DUF1206 domain-containing protein [Micrococcus sp.]